MEISPGAFYFDCLQLENILLDDNFTAKLSDFGFAARINTDSQLTGMSCTVIHRRRNKFCT